MYIWDVCRGVSSVYSNNAQFLRHTFSHANCQIMICSSKWQINVWKKEISTIHKQTNMFHGDLKKKKKTVKRQTIHGTHKHRKSIAIDVDCLIEYWQKHREHGFLGSRNSFFMSVHLNCHQKTTPEKIWRAHNIDLILECQPCHFYNKLESAA